MRVRLLAAVMAMVLVTGACSFDELLDFIATSEEGNPDLSQSEETAPAAASVPAKSADERAKAASERALETKNPVAVTPAIEARPLDPRYLIQRGIMRGLEGDGEGALDDLGSSRARSNENHHLKSKEEQERRWVEAIIETSHRMMASYEEGTEEHEKLVRYYCDNLTTYAIKFGTSFEGGLFLQFANSDIC